MPLFFIISGYLYKNISVKELLKKSKSLLIAYTATVLAYVVYNFIFVNHNEALRWLISGLYGGTQNRFSYLYGVGGIWFLLALFWARLFMHYILLIEEKIYQMIIVGVLAYTVVRTYGVFTLPWCIQNGVLACLFIYVGYIFKENNFFEKIHPMIWLVCTVLWLYGCLQGEIQEENMIMVICDVTSLLSVIRAVLGTIMVVGVARVIEKIKYLREPFILIGRITLYILCTHIFELTTGIMELLREVVIDRWEVDIHIFVYRCVWSFGVAILIYLIVEGLKINVNYRVFGN